ncbi:MAG: hypothetical protein Q8Q08_08100 [Candidatus Omnitrophota bacterium]|nr:hypothetical protein [Candidatus Omnitrophota bacterium]MDZ4242075.1 hypothetical protein [Candidatus Omnitrophota bacterium]
MARKGKQVVWHKKKGKMIPSVFLKPHGSAAASAPSPPASAGQADRRKTFAAKFLKEIKRAASDQTPEGGSHG